MIKTPPETLLGFDYGSKRIGVAVGQTVTKTARALATVKAKSGTPQWDVLDKIIKVWQPDALVVGIPLNMNGTEQPLTQDAKKFADELKTRYNRPVFGVDERLSTKDARERLFNEGGYKALQSGMIDSVAAQLILQTWLNQNS